MITLKQWMEACNYRVTEGSEYQWQCFGYEAYRLDSWDGDQDGHTLSIVFDKSTQEVYEVSVYDYQRSRAYRMINPAYREAFNNEVKERGVEDMAWEDDQGVPVKYVDLEVVEDYLEKAQAIVNGEEYDTRVQVPITLEDSHLFELMKMAHERDITFNQMVENVLRQAIESSIIDELNQLTEEYHSSKKKKGKK